MIVSDGFSSETRYDSRILTETIMPIRMDCVGMVNEGAHDEGDGERGNIRSASPTDRTGRTPTIKAVETSHAVIEALLSLERATVTEVASEVDISKGGVFCCVE